jgi:Predicted membrane protein
MIRWVWSPALWSGIGLTGQVLFGSRFLVQWIASESAKRSIVPRAFWYLSVLGGVTLCAYACYRRDPVFGIGQGAGLLVYARNLMLPRSSASPA